MTASMRAPLPAVRPPGPAGSAAGVVGTTTISSVGCTNAAASNPAAATTTLVSVWCAQPTKVGWL